MLLYIVIHLFFLLLVIVVYIQLKQVIEEYHIQTNRCFNYNATEMNLLRAIRNGLSEQWTLQLSVIPVDCKSNIYLYKTFQVRILQIPNENQRIRIINSTFAGSLKAPSSVEFSECN